MMTLEIFVDIMQENNDMVVNHWLLRLEGNGDVIGKLREKYRINNEVSRLWGVKLCEDDYLPDGIVRLISDYETRIINIEKYEMFKTENSFSRVSVKERAISAIRMVKEDYISRDSLDIIVRAIERDLDSVLMHVEIWYILHMANNKKGMNYHMEVWKEIIKEVLSPLFTEVKEEKSKEEFMYKAIIKFDDKWRKDIVLLEEEQLETVEKRVEKVYADGYIKIVNKDTDSMEISSYYSLDEIDKIVIVQC